MLYAVKKLRSVIAVFNRKECMMTWQRTLDGKPEHPGWYVVYSVHCRSHVKLYQWTGFEWLDGCPGRLGAGTMEDPLYWYDVGLPNA